MSYQVVVLPQAKLDVEIFHVRGASQDLLTSDDLQIPDGY